MGKLDYLRQKPWEAWFWDIQEEKEVTILGHKE